jgi:hypothetical protein
MNEKNFLDKNDLIEILKKFGYWEATYGTSPKFYTKFIEETILHVKSIDVEYFKKNLPSKNNHFTYNVHQDCQKFIDIFSNKIPLPETFTILKLNQNYYGSTHEKKRLKELISFLENKIGPKGLHDLLENYFEHYTSLDNSFLFSYWFETLKNNKSWINESIAEKFINQYLSREPTNTVTRNFNLKLLLFINQFKDNSKQISNYIEKHQGDSVFIKGVKKATPKVKNLSWNETETPLLNSKKIVGTLGLNSEFFIKEYNMTRGDSEKFIQESLSFLYQKFKELSLGYTSFEVIIYANNIDDYKNKEQIVLEKFEQIKILAPYWLKEKHNNCLTFFNNYFEKINIHKELSEEILNKKDNNLKAKKIKI